jgi:enoyl-CoA hydratase/carnithine racemase
MRPQRLSAAQALTDGLVDEVVAADGFAAALEQAAAELAAVPPFVPATLKRRLLPRGQLAASLDRELDATMDAQLTPEHLRAVQAFRSSGRPRPAAAAATAAWPDAVSG